MATNITNVHIKNLISFIQKRFLSTSTTLTTTPSSSFAVQYLVNSCGLPLQSAISVSKKLRTRENNFRKHQHVIEFLKSHDFSGAYIVKLIEKWPNVLNCKVDTNLKPKFDFFIKIGFVGQLLPQLIVTDTAVLKVNLDSVIRPRFGFFMQFIDSPEKIVVARKRSPSWFALTSALQVNVDFLMEEGMAREKVAKLIMWQSRSVQIKHANLVNAVNAVKNLGLEPKDHLFIYALGVLTGMSESSWRKKIEALKSLGWDGEQIKGAFKRCPLLLACSEKKLTSAMDFLLNTVKLEMESIIAEPKFLMYSTDKRLRPRYDVIKVLESKKLIKGDSKKIARLFKITEKDFFKNYVTKHVDQAPGLLEIYGRSDTKTLKGRA